MALTTGAWSLGLVVGPAVGGMLSRPCEQYPGTFPPEDHPLLALFPYLLPNLFSAAVALIAMVFVYLYFPETLYIEITSGKVENTCEEGVLKRDDEESSSLIDVSDSGSAAVLKSGDSATATSACALLSIPGVAVYITAYFSVSFTAIVYDEVMPLWGLSSTAKGGVGLDSKDIGQVRHFCMSFSFVLGYEYCGNSCVALHIPRLSLPGIDLWRAELL